MKIGAKLIISFMAVTAIFVFISFYMIMMFGKLQDLQDEGAGRAEDAVTINRIVASVLNVYPIIADSIINRNFVEAESDFRDMKLIINEHLVRLDKLVDTEDEVESAEVFRDAMGRYLDLYENSMLPVLSSSDTVAERSQDSIHILEMKYEIEAIYGVIADSIINRDLIETRTELNEIKKLAEISIEEIDSLVDTPEEVANAESLKESYNEYITYFENTMLPEIINGASMDRIAELDNNIDIIRRKLLGFVGAIAEDLNEETLNAVDAENAVRKYDEQIDNFRDIAIESLRGIEVSLKEEQEEADRQFDETILQTITMAIILALIGVAGAVFLALLITRNIRKSVVSCLDLAEGIATGDLTQSVVVKGKDEIAQLTAAISEMQKKLREVVTDVFRAADQVAGGSEQLAQSSEQMSQGATEQAANAEEVSSSIEEMSSGIQQNADNASQTEKMARKAAADAENGGEAVSDVVDAMKEIAAKIVIIDDIARQTNMLSLNAAIEAARAGEHGKGFAVVASEVGKLAANSQNSAAEIRELADSSVSKADQAGAVIKSMVPDIQKTAELIMEISSSSNEQNTGINQINSAMMQLDQVIQQNAASAEESSSMSEELTSQARELNSMISFFKVE